MKKLLLILSIIICFPFHSVFADKQPETEKEKNSYAIGIQFAQEIKQHGIDIDTESFVQAIKDVLDNKQLKLTLDEMREVLTRYQEKQLKLRNEQAENNKQSGVKFLADNKSKENVVELPSGLQYKIIKQGSGPRPTLDDTVVVHYQGTLLNGKIFDSSYNRGEPTSISLTNVIAGWQQTLPLMTVGSKWQIFVPSELAYGERAAGPDITPNSTLIFDIELISIN